MNLLCEHSMIRAYANQTQPVSASSVQVVAKALQFDDVKPIAGHSAPEVSARPIEFGTEHSVDDPLLELEPGVTLEPVTKETVPEPRRLEKEPENPRWTWFEATLAPDSDPMGDAASQTLTPEPEKQPRPVLVSEFRSSLSVTENSGAFAAVEPVLGDESLLPQPQPVKKPIEITSAVKRNRSQQARQAFTTGQDYLAIFFARASEATLDAWDNCVAFARSQEWERYFDALVRWLQQPLPTVKVNRRAGGD
jgi:hypothetical protein